MPRSGCSALHGVKNESQFFFLKKGLICCSLNLTVLGRGLRRKTSALFVFFLWFVKFFEKLVKSMLFDRIEKCGHFSDFQYGFRSFQLYLIELLGLIIGLGLLELWYLIYQRLLTGYSMLIFFTNSNLKEFLPSYMALFCLLLIIDGFEWLIMGTLCSSIQLMLEFLKPSLLVLQFSYCTLITLLTM